MNTELATIHQESAVVAVEVTALAWATKAGKPRRPTLNALKLRRLLPCASPMRKPRRSQP